MPLTTQFRCFQFTVLCSAALLFASGSAVAMEIKQFDQMIDKDRARYVTTLFDESVKYLQIKGREDDAKKVNNLFFDKPPGSTVSKGMHEFMEVLQGLHNVNRDKPIHVEHAMAIMLKRHGVVIPMNDFMQLTKDFKASHIEEVIPPGLNQ
jgi:hypothetical protein